MCGLVGMAGDLTIKDRELFEDMLDVCQLRGRDSTGAIRVSRKGDEYTYAKRVGPPAYLFDSREYEQNIRKIGISALIGHCRHATVGGISTRTAHPFDIEEAGIIGVHNGTLRNYHRFPEHHAGMTDSQVLYERIAARGAVETFEDLEGAWACVWWDHEEEKLNFIRNKERPLYFTYSEDKRKMFWASEPWMFAAIYRKEKLWDGGPEKKVYISLEEDTLYQLEIDANAAAGKPVFKVSEGRKIEKKSVTVIGFGAAPGTNTNNTSQTTSPTFTTKGGEVANPFRDDELPHHLTVPAKQPAQTTKSMTTQPSSSSSSTPSKSSLAPSTQSMSTTTSVVPITSHQSTNLQDCQRTSRKRLSVVSEHSPSGGSNPTPDLGKIYQANVGVDTRYIKAVDTEYITDRRTGREVDEKTFKEETGGKCCHCGTELWTLGEVAEIYDNGKRYICTDCVTPRADPVAEVLKELA